MAYWINYFVNVVNTGERIEKHVICDSYNAVFHKVVTEKWEGKVNEGDIIESYIIPESAIIDINEFNGELGKCNLYHSSMTWKEIVDFGYLDGDCEVCDHYETCKEKGII